MRIAKKKSLVLVLAILIAAGLFFIFAVFSPSSEWKQTVVSLQNLPHHHLEAAVKAFARDRKVTNGQVSLGELIKGGYVGIDEVGSLTNKDVAVSLTADETTPQAILIRVPTSGGYDIVLLGDGSIQKAQRR